MPISGAAAAPPPLAQLSVATTGKTAATVTEEASAVEVLAKAPKRFPAALRWIRRKFAAGAATFEPKSNSNTLAAAAAATAAAKAVTTSCSVRGSGPAFVVGGAIDGSALRRQVRRQLIDDFARGSQQLRRF